jgi:Cytochrome c
MYIKNMRGIISAALVCMAFIALLGLVAAGHARDDKTGPAIDVARGKYLVEEVAKCPECHTPRDASGNLDTHAWLQGAPIWIRPVRPIPNWADQVPALVGLPSFTDVEMERVLEKGIGPQGESLRPPMHIYHMTPQDAKAIIAYLKSLPAQKH